MRHLAVTTLGFCLDYDVPIPRWAQDLPIRTIYLHAESRYRPTGTVREEIVLFRATSGEGPEEPYAHRYEDPMLGWEKRTARGVLAIDVPGGHGTMLQEPNVKVIADIMRSELESGALPSREQHDLPGGPNLGGDRNLDARVAPPHPR